jgi:low molecular weight protein-tyrosine phosphatase
MADVAVCFVCLGNICRSPTAEAVFADILEREGLADRVRVASAGTGDWHVGEPPDARATAEAARRGIRMRSTARQFRAADFERFDLVIAMDEENRRNLERLAGNGDRAAKVRLLRSFDPRAGGDLAVPDPYFGGADGFVRVFDLVDAACRGLLDHLREGPLAAAAR